MSSQEQAGVLAPPSTMAIRQMLFEAVVRDLQGPAQGPEEEVAEERVRDRYIAGVLAPGRQVLKPEEDDDLAASGADSIDEGPAEPSAPARRTLFPASFGFSFSVDLNAPALRIEARWGQYLRQVGQSATKKDGSPAMVWKRHPRGGVSQPIPLAAGPLRPWTPDPDCPGVRVEGIVRKRAGHWSVTLFLINGQQEPDKSRDAAWLFQAELSVEAADGQPVFVRRREPRPQGSQDDLDFAEQQAMEMLYRRRVEFAIGHGIAVHAELAEGPGDRARRLVTRAIPFYEVPRVTPPTADDIPRIADLVLDMKRLAEAADEELPRFLEALPTAYEEWIAGQAELAEKDEMTPHREAARAALERCRTAQQRIREGLQLLQQDTRAAGAFRFANRAMYLQRLHTQWSEKRRQGNAMTLESLDEPRNRSWYPFQLAFLLINLPGITRLDHADRTGGEKAICDLLWFPTGGGKTEAYLGLAAYTMGLRRLQSMVEGRSGEDGLAVLMRYTLRLLTLQQFQRAAALLCACEAIRREAAARNDHRWGATPFRLGLWVGQKTTPNTTEQSAEAISQAIGNRNGQMGGGAGTPCQLTTCPWCGSPVQPGKNVTVDKYPSGYGRTFLYCGDAQGTCLFTARRSPNEGIPVVVVDEEIYRRLPSMMIATVDKFAQMPWNGQVQMLFGQVTSRCERHGFRSPEVEDSDTHPAKAPLPAAKTLPSPLLRPPDLIIQDELHLISGPLGSLMGIYETAIDDLCSWTVNGKTIRPKVVASTATIRRAQDQVHAVFLRRVEIFPPHGLDVRDNFFALERQPSEKHPGRLYLGICAPGRRVKQALIRSYVAFLAAAQQLYRRYDEAADPYMTLVGYFNAMRELGGMRRVVDDDVRTRLSRMQERGLEKRNIPFSGVEELTSRRSSSDIPQLLDRLEVAFDPAKKENAARRIDVLLATNMVSVGVDVKRLGLMVVAGQPKSTAEYIQATSRVGRSAPGIVCTVYNWARPRDLSHFESFEHYHATFYQHVEPLSVTPFSPGARSRALTALLVSCIRLRGTDFNANARAGALQREHENVEKAINAIIRRAELTGAEAQQVRKEIEHRLDLWLQRAKHGNGSQLGYRTERDGTTLGLLQRPSLDPWSPFTCLNSLREVEPTVSLILSDGVGGTAAPDGDVAGDAQPTGDVQ